jgi:hypothetical protein
MTPPLTPATTLFSPYPSLFYNSPYRIPGNVDQRVRTTPFATLLRSAAVWVGFAGCKSVASIKSLLVHDPHLFPDHPPRAEELVLKIEDHELEGDRGLEIMEGAERFPLSSLLRALLKSVFSLLLSFPLIHRPHFRPELSDPPLDRLSEVLDLF